MSVELYKSEVKLNVLPLHVRLLFLALVAFTIRGRFLHICLHLYVIVITYACIYVFVDACNKSVHSESAGIKFARLPFMPSGGNTIKRICSLSPRNFAQIFNLSSPFEQLLNVLLCCFVQLNCNFAVTMTVFCIRISENITTFAVETLVAVAVATTPPLSSPLLLLLLLFLLSLFLVLLLILYSDAFFFLETNNR